MDGRLIQCGYCGRVTKLTRTDKTACGNLCSSKIIYARKHSFETPFETFLRLTKEESEDVAEANIASLELESLVKIERNNEVRPTEKNIIKKEDSMSKISAKAKTGLSKVSKTAALDNTRYAMEEKLKKYSNQLKTM